MFRTCLPAGRYKENKKILLISLRLINPWPRPACQTAGRPDFHGRTSGDVTSKILLGYKLNPSKLRLPIPSRSRDVEGGLVHPPYFWRINPVKKNSAAGG